MNGVERKSDEELLRELKKAQGRPYLYSLLKRGYQKNDMKLLTILFLGFSSDLSPTALQLFGKINKGQDIDGLHLTDCKAEHHPQLLAITQVSFPTVQKE
ncbi:hypothetical protein TURU_098387 [Turdus rufiventris]|nr:hypothetical protein TURU_098387 [Turdus rufiventris]